MKGVRRSRPWRPALWERVYRGETLWVEEMFNRSPKWSWDTTGARNGRAKSKLAAMRAAEKAIDTDIATLNGPAATGDGT